MTFATHSSPRSVRRMFGGGLAVALVALAGCGGPTPTAEVTGTFTYQGKPVAAGSVVVTSVEKPDLIAVGQLSDAGKFRVVGAPTGAVRLHIDTSSYKPRNGVTPAAPGMTNRPPAGAYPKGGGGGPPAGGAAPNVPAGVKVVMHKGSEGEGVVTTGKYVPIPDSYDKAETAGLERSLKSGVNDLGNIELKGDVKK